MWKERAIDRTSSGLSWENPLIGKMVCFFLAARSWLAEEIGTGLSVDRREPVELLLYSVFAPQSGCVFLAAYPVPRQSC